MKHCEAAAGCVVAVSHGSGDPSRHQASDDPSVWGSCRQLKAGPSAVGLSSDTPRKNESSDSQRKENVKSMKHPGSELEQGLLGGSPLCLGEDIFPGLKGKASVFRLH